ncbi:Protein-export membrane protein SecG [Nitrospira tepida]|uniref:Protein-export membrane protein SecG n=1 Tax=Nitrospira tepida TaxID=2973512 RepID=A0AA86MXM3_9BACT|nr:preprotein translocase subunit SecG [Nitrospira tepida]CAI4030947.1 Protein-export membrane protein SecG [Nitrospira tepida]
MYTLLIIVHILTCFFMIATILLQSGKGAEIGAAFGGSSQTVFGSRGPANFLSKLTVACAAVFMVTSLTLAVLAKERTFSSTVIDLNKKESSTPSSSAPSSTDQKPAESAPSESSK